MGGPDHAAALNLFVRLAAEAGAIIMDVYESRPTVEIKPDCSPVTEADRLAEELILRGLRAGLPGIPCVAEEEVAAGRVPDTGAQPFILVDPLDGTREFVGRKPDFTVNIALVAGGEPLVGVVLAPARRQIFAGRPGEAWQADLTEEFDVLERRPMRVSPASRPLRIVASRSHRTPETDAFIARYPGAEIVAVGSSLKFCLLASGAADLYPRFGRTMEWDTAAGDAVLRAAGGMTTTLDGAPLRYGKRNQAHDTDFANPYFIAAVEEIEDAAAGTTDAAVLA